MQFSIAKPEEVGVSSAALSQTLDYLAQRRVALHSLLVMRHDALICEGYAAPFTKDTLHRMYSETKSLVSLAVGVMCAKGYLDLDDHIVDHFAEKLPLGGPSPELARLTIRDMLRMATPYNGTTYKRRPTQDWVGSFFTARTDHEPGSFFCYDTSSSHTLCALVEKRMGRPLLDVLRREALDALLKKREVLRPWPVHEAEPDALPLRTLPPRRTLRARFEAWEQVPEQALSGVEYLILPIAQADRVPREWREKTLLELPRVMFGALEEDTARRIAATQDAGFAGYEVSNIAHLRLCRGLPMTGGFGLNVTNQMAAQFYADHGLNSVLILPEVKDSDISTIAPTHNGKPVPTGVLVYGHMPLMVTRACPLQNIHDCAHCNKAGELTDRKAKKFPVRCGMGVRTIYNPVPIYMGDKPGALTVDYGVAYFTLESREEAAAILDSIRVHAPFEGEFTRGLYFKGTN